MKIRRKNSVLAAWSPTNIRLLSPPPPPLIPTPHSPLPPPPPPPHRSHFRILQELSPLRSKPDVDAIWAMVDALGRSARRDSESRLHITGDSCCHLQVAMGTVYIRCLDATSRMASRQPTCCFRNARASCEPVWPSG